jgi:tetratricopeptide (TPR) repeat protein
MAMTARCAALAAFAFACAATPKHLVVPQEMRRSAQPAATPDGDKPSPAAMQGVLQPAGARRASADGKYVLRLSEHNRVWELELPEASGGYEMSIPLAGPLDSPTLADEEMLGPGEAKPGKAKDPQKSYLATLAKVREMYASRRYEMALVEVVDLESSHPSDARLLAMKGSLYLKLGKKDLARSSWEKALSLDPKDAAVAEALRHIKEE